MICKIKDFVIRKNTNGIVILNRTLMTRMRRMTTLFAAVGLSGQASDNGVIAAHGLGLGARIYGSPVANVNSRREVFQIPPGYKAVMILRIGNPDKNVDAVSAASPRKGFEEVVNFKKE